MASIGSADFSSSSTVIPSRSATCFLRALESFRPGYSYTLEDLSLHSGLREKIEKKEIEGSKAEMLTLWFALEPEDHSRLKEIAPRLEGIETLKVTKCFNGSYHIESPELSLDEEEIPQTQAVRGSNYCDIGVKVVEKSNLAIIMSAIDNLTKGASSQALQNMNIVVGFDETAGLLYPGLMP